MAVTVFCKFTKRLFWTSDKPVIQSQAKEYREELRAAMAIANSALELTMEERLQKYNFEKRFAEARKAGGWTAKRTSRNTG